MSRQRNPSSLSRRLPVVVLAIAGAAVATYLTLFQLDLVASVWDPLFGAGSRRVLTSSLSEALPVPDALLGVAAYVIEGVLESIGGSSRWRHRPRLVLLCGLVAGGLGLAALALLAVQVLVVGDFCTLCLLSAAISLSIVVLVSSEVLAATRTLRRSGAR